MKITLDISDMHLGETLNALNDHEDVGTRDGRYIAKLLQKCREKIAVRILLSSITKGVTKMTSYRLRQLGRLLKNGDAAIVGITSLGYEWPNEPHAWVIHDYTAETSRLLVSHVDLDTRPKWSRYYSAFED